MDRIPESISSCVRVRLPGSDHVGSTRGGRLPVAVDGLTNSQIWPIIAVDLTISNHGIQSAGTLRMVLAVVVTAEDILLDMMWLILFAVKKQRESRCSVEAAQAHNYETYAGRKSMCGMEVN